MIGVFPVCLGLYDRLLVFKNLELLPYHIYIRIPIMMQQMTHLNGIFPADIAHEMTKRKRERERERERGRERRRERERV